MRSNSSMISVRVSKEIANRLDKLAKSMDRSRSYLAVEAIEEYLDLHEWQVRGIQQGLLDVEKGRVLNFSDVKAEWEKRK